MRRETGVDDIRKWRLTLRRIGRDWWTVLGLISLCVFLTLGVIGPAVAPFGAREFAGPAFAPPSRQFLLGTDNLGRDVFSQILLGTRVTLLVAFGAAGVSLLLGTALGAIAGYFGGVIDDVLSRVFEVVLTVPRLFLVLLAVAFLGTSVWITIGVIGLTIWPVTARIMRAEVLSVRERAFVTAARAGGLGELAILWRHVVPNSLTAVIANTSLQMAVAVLLEAGLSFLGLGDPNQITWGQIIHAGQSYLKAAWWLTVMPGGVIVLLLVSLHLVGDGLSEAFDPTGSRGRA